MYASALGFLLSGGTVWVVSTHTQAFPPATIKAYWSFMIYDL